MKRFVFPVVFMLIIGGFVFSLVKVSRGRVPALAVPKTSQAVIDRAVSFGCTSGESPNLFVPYRDYCVVDKGVSCPRPPSGTNCGSGDVGSGGVVGFCQDDEPPGQIMDGGRYSWTMPDNQCGATANQMSPSCNDTASGEFWGVIQYIEAQLREMLKGEDIIPMINGMLCGQGAHAASSSSVSGVNACAAADLCVFDAGKGGFKAAGNCSYEGYMVTSCYGTNSGSGAATVSYDSDGDGTFDTTWNTANDGWILYANRGEGKVWYNSAEGKIEALIALWGDSHAKRIPPLPPIGYGWDQNDPGTTSENNNRTYDRVCVEAEVKLCENDSTKCPGATGDCGAVAVRANLDLYADALVIKTKLNIVRDPNNPNIIDLCPAFDPSTGKPSVNTTWIELVDQDIEPNLTVDLGVMGCTCVVDPDASFPPDTLNEQLAGLIFDTISNLLHGTCKGNINFCNRPPSTPLPACDGSNCTNPNIRDERCDPCDNDCDNVAGISQSADINESLKNEGAGCDPCDLPAEKMDNPQGGNTTGWDYCVRGAPEKTGTAGACSVGLLPMDLSNVLQGLLFGDMPISINDPEYSQLDPDYGSLTLFGVKYDLGCYPQGFDIRPYGCYSTIDAAFYPRWSEYELCADVAEVGEYPNRTMPPQFYPFAPTQAGAPSPPYHFVIGLNQDMLSEIAYSLYVSSLACNVFDENSIICDLLGFFGGGNGTEKCPFMKVSTQRSVTPGLKLADPDCYVQLRMRPAGSPSARTGPMTYSAQWPPGYPTQLTQGTYDGAMFVPNFYYEVRAPLDDHVPGVCSNPPVTVLVYDTNGFAGLDVEYINQIHPAFPDEAGYIHIFLDIAFHLNEIRYSAEYGLSPVEQKDSVNQFIGLITNIYLATLMNFRFQLPFISDPSDPLTIKFTAARPSSVANEQGGQEAIDYLFGAWEENTSGDYLVIYGLLEGKLNLYPLIKSLGLFSPPEIRKREEIEKLYPETFIKLPQWSDEKLPVQIELSPFETARLFEDHTISFHLNAYDDDTPSGLIRYTYRLNNALWSVPKGISKLQLSYLPDGYYKLEVAAIDKKQRMDPTPAVVRFVVDKTPPRVEPLEEKVVVRDEIYRLPLFIEDNITRKENLKARFRVDNDEWVYFSPAFKYVEIPLRTKGLHDITVEVYDEAGNIGVYKRAVFKSEKGKGFSCGLGGDVIKGYSGVFLSLLISMGIPLFVLIVLRLRERGERKSD